MGVMLSIIISFRKEIGFDKVYDSEMSQNQI
jgi:hypothetical protein